MIPYLTFSGNCRDALNFYKEVFDADILKLQSFGDSPVPVEEAFKERIFDSELRGPDIHFKASDDLPSHQVQFGSNISLFIKFDDTQKMQAIFDQLKEEGSVLFPLEGGFGMVKDKYQYQWMLALNQ